MSAPAFAERFDSLKSRQRGSELCGRRWFDVLDFVIGWRPLWNAV